MSAPGWEVAVGGQGGRLRIHKLRAGILGAKIAEWADRGTLECEVWAQFGDPEWLRFPVSGWSGRVEDIEQNKARAEAEIRRIAGEALAALGGDL